MLAPITGPASSIGSDQLHWAQFYVSNWNKAHKLKLKLVQGDTQLDPSKASTVAQSFASNKSIMHVVEGISDRVIALDHGEKISEGTFEQVATDPRVVEAYLGAGTGTATK